MRKENAFGLKVKFRNRKGEYGPHLIHGEVLRDYRHCLERKYSVEALQIYANKLVGKEIKVVIDLNTDALMGFGDLNVKNERRNTETYDVVLTDVLYGNPYLKIQSKIKNPILTQTTH